MGENLRMNNSTKGIQKAIIFWLSGVRLADIRTLPEVTRLIDHGAMVELDVSPITGLQNQHYQVLSGREPSSFGYFDTIVPREYSVLEETTGRGTTPKLLPEILRTAGWVINYEEIQQAELINCVAHCTQYSYLLPSYLIMTCTLEVTSIYSTISKQLRMNDEMVVIMR